MTLPPQQPAATPESPSAAQASTPQRVAPSASAAQAVPTSPTTQPGIRPTVTAAGTSSSGGMQEDRFAAGARMDMPGQTPEPTSPFEEGVVADPMRVFSGPGYSFPPSPVNRPAQFALWVSLIAILFPFALVASIGAGVWGLVHAQMNYGVGRRQAAAALIISALALLWWLFVWAAVMGLLPTSL